MAGLVTDVKCFVSICRRAIGTKLNMVVAYHEYQHGILDKLARVETFGRRLRTQMPKSSLISCSLLVEIGSWYKSLYVLIQFCLVVCWFKLVAAVYYLPRYLMNKR